MYQNYRKPKLLHVSHRDTLGASIPIQKKSEATLQI